MRSTLNSNYGYRRQGSTKQKSRAREIKRDERSVEKELDLKVDNRKFKKIIESSVRISNQSIFVGLRIEAIEGSKKLLPIIYPV